MKKLWILLAWAAIAAACSNEAELHSPQPSENEMVEVSFNLGGDYVSVEETPMTRADEGKTYYQINIFKLYRPKEIVSYIPYAGGRFSSLENARITLPKHNRYCFIVEVMKEQEEALGIQVCDSFVTGDKASHYSFNKPPTELYNCDYYYSVENAVVDSTGPINIDLKKYSFSITCSVAKPMDGTVVVTLPKYNKEIWSYSYYEDKQPKQMLYNFPKMLFSTDDLSSAFIWKFEDSSVDIDVNVVWKRSSPLSREYSTTKTITVKRNMNYNLNIDMNAREDENSFELTVENAEMKSEDVTIN